MNTKCVTGRRKSLNPGYGNSAAVKVALAENYIILETKNYLERSKCVAFFFSSRNTTSLVNDFYIERP